MKSALVHRYAGFAGVAVKGRKAEFDDTPGRTWRVANATFSLRRGNSAEVLDMYAYQLDNSFDEYFAGGVKTETPIGVGVSVAPWNSGIRKILE